MNTEVQTFSNNVFDFNLLTKKEIIEMIKNFISTIDILDIPLKNKEHTVGKETMQILRDFGILESDEIDILEKKIGSDIYVQLIKAVNKIKAIDIDSYPDVKKYSYSKRNEMVKQEKNSGKPTMVDLFCGAGGLSLGLTQSGFRVVFANDIEKSALRTYSFNHPEVEGKKITMGGIENIAHSITNYIEEEVDILVGGPPCQGFSNANRQRIIDDPRNVLYKYYVESLHQIQPKFFIMENVKGMLKVADQVVDDFNADIRIGYSISYKVLNAKYMGVPQNRERLIYIGIREDIREKLKITPTEIFDILEKDKNTGKEVSLIDAIKDLKVLNASRIKNSTSGDKESGYILSKKEKEKESVSDYVDLINQKTKNVPIIYNHKARFNNDRDIEIYKRMLPGDNSLSPRIADIMPYHSRSHMFKDKYFKLLPDSVCKTITAHMKFDCNMYIHPFQARGLTPREAARVQSFADNYFFLGSYTKTYQQIGNSVPPLMAKKIGNIIIKYLKET